MVYTYNIFIHSSGSEYLAWFNVSHNESTPVFLPGKSQGQRSLEGYNPEGCKELDMTKQLKNNNNMILHFVQNSEKVALCTLCRIQKSCPLGWGGAASQAHSLAGRAGTGFQPPPAPFYWLSCRKEQLGRGGGHYGRPVSPFGFFCAVQASSYRVQFENYPNQCSLMVPKHHGPRQVNGSIPPTEVTYHRGFRGLPWGLALCASSKLVIISWSWTFFSHLLPHCRKTLIGV